MRRLLLLFWVVFPLNALADSDGVFCIGSGYVALETRNLHIDERTNDNKDGVFIIKVGKEGISARIFVESDFDKSDYNKQISCEKNRVLLSNGFEGNVIDLTIDKPKATKVKIEKNTQFSDKYLPFIHKSESIKITSDDDKHSYWLLLTAHEQRPSSPPEFYSILHHFSARVVKLNKHGHSIDWKHLAYGISEESWGE